MNLKKFPHLIDNPSINIYPTIHCDYKKNSNYYLSKIESMEPSLLIETG